MSVYVLGVGVWEGSAAKPAAALLPARMRGRASPLTSMLAEVVEQATREAGVSAATLPSVFGSAYGEMNTTGALLAQLWAAGGQLSPAKFQASVHNTAAAQLSIALHNSSFTTSIAAGHDTVAMSLLEATCWLARNPGQVLVACADEAPNQVLQPEAAYAPLAAAFVLDNVSGRGLARIELLPTDALSAADRAKNPCAAAIDLVRAVSASEPTDVAMHGGWRVHVEPAAVPADKGPHD
ncbi:MAG TPA: beta-ketoacyl synthase chain length factor [Polyangiales bacterium]|nr:beta-ketoacyl synthase chain length factor [Polyangiales bacterium]